MKEERNTYLWSLTAKISLAFALLVSVVLIFNYVQYKTMDPVETKLITSLVLRLNENPDDAQLRDEIRALDLLSRKAYFTKQWQIRTGGYLLLISMIVLLVSMQMQLSDKGKEVDLEASEQSFANQKKSRLWVSLIGGSIVIMALVFAFLNHQDLGSNLREAIAEKQLADETQNTPITQAAFTPDSPTEETGPPLIDEEAPIKENPSVKEEVANIEEPNQKAEAQKEIKEEIKKEIPQEELVIEEPAQAFPTEAEIKANFASFRGFGSNGVDFHKNIPTTWNGETGENILWKAKIPIHGYNSPIIWGNQLFLSGANPQKREVYCLDRNSGKILWTADVKEVPGTPAKSPKVTDDTGLAAPTLTTNGHLVFALFGNGDLIAIKMDGTRIWAKNLGPTNNHYGHSSSLAIHEEVLIVQYDIKNNPKLMGINIHTGESLWETPRKVKISWASPVVVNTGNKTEVIVIADPTIASYDPKTGAENWQLDCIFGEVGPSVAYGDGMVFGVNEYATLVAIKLGDTPEILWENDELLSDVPSPVVFNGLLFLATSYGVVVCYDAVTGEKYWEQEFENGFYGSPMYAEGNIYIMDMDGFVHVFKAGKSYEAVSSNPLGESGMTTPAFMDGRIYIRGNEHLICIGK